MADPTNHAYGIPLVLGPRTGMQDPSVYVVSRPPNQAGVPASECPSNKEDSDFLLGPLVGAQIHGKS